MKPLSKALFLAALATATTAVPAHANDRYLGEIFEFGGNFCPQATLPTDGRLLSVDSNASLFSLLGTMYGGDGRRTFALPLISKTDDSGRKVTTCIVAYGLFPVRQRN